MSAFERTGQLSWENLSSGCVQRHLESARKTDGEFVKKAMNLQD